MTPEDAVHFPIVEYLRFYLPNEVVWFHVPNGGNLPVQFKMKLKKRGQLPGAPDLVFLWPKGWGGIEIKAEGGRLSAAQKAVRERFINAGGRYAVCRSIEDVEETMREWAIKS